MSVTSSVRSLLLNAGYEPVRIISWQRAIVLFFQGKVDILEYHSTFARSVRSSFQLPSVLRLRRYVRPRLHGPIRFCRENIYIRDNFTCQYCGDRFNANHLTLDHVIPASLNGKKSWTNVVAACRPCNQRKANRTPQTANMPLLKEPASPSWLPKNEFSFNTEEMPLTWGQYLRFSG